MVLVDTSIWIDYLSPRPGPSAARLDQLLEAADPFAMTPIILQEILQGSRSPEEFRRLKRNLSTQHLLYVADPVESHVAAAELYTRCRRAGVTPRSAIDCLIAQIAIDNRVPLMHNDSDFQKMARVIPQLMIY